MLSSIDINSNPYLNEEWQNKNIIGISNSRDLFLNDKWIKKDWNESLISVLCPIFQKYCILPPTLHPLYD